MVPEGVVAVEPGHNADQTASVVVAAVAKHDAEQLVVDVAATAVADERLLLVSVVLLLGVTLLPVVSAFPLLASFSILVVVGPIAVAEVVVALPLDVSVRQLAFPPHVSDVLLPPCADALLPIAGVLLPRAVVVPPLAWSVPRFHADVELLRFFSSRPLPALLFVSPVLAVVLALLYSLPHLVHPKVDQHFHRLMTLMGLRGSQVSQCDDVVCTRHGPVVPIPRVPFHA